jgi:putative membrane protein
VKRLARGIFGLGLIVTVVLVIRGSAQSIAGLLDKAGWRLLWLAPLHAVPLLPDVVGWQVLIFERTRLRSLFVIASIREAINRLLPVANVGGEIVGIRLLSREGIPGANATSSVVVEMLLNLVAQSLFFNLGVALLLRITGSAQGSLALLIGVVGPVTILALFYWLVNSGALFTSIEKLWTRILNLRPTSMNAVSNFGQLDIAVRRLASAHGRLARGTLWQLAGLIIGTSETWLALKWLGHSVSIPVALVLESFTLAARSLFFFAPAGLGVQEAGLVGVGHLLGVGGDVAITLSLAKRMREVLFGLPALAIWRFRATRGGIA